MKDHNQEGRTSTIATSDIPCEMNRSMGSLDGTEDFLRRSIYEKNKLYKAIIAFFFALKEKLGNQGKRTVMGAVPFFSISIQFFLI